jgi:hypothetical protein
MADQLQVGFALITFMMRKLYPFWILVSGCNQIASISLQLVLKVSYPQAIESGQILGEGMFNM